MIEMSKRKIASVVILILCMSLTSCSKTALSDEEKCSVVSEIAETCLEAASKVKVHDRSGFDGNQIYIDAKVKDGVYKYSAGL